jgi:glycosyltransferase involved in cell wall biosynthesis
LIDYLAIENPLFLVSRISSLLGGLCTWLLEKGNKHGVSKRQVAWFILEVLEDPSRELWRVYITNPAWQKYFPEVLCLAEWERLLQWLRDRYGLVAGHRIESELVGRVRGEATVRDNDRPGLNVLGHFCTRSGLQSSANSVVESLKHVGIGTCCRDVPLALERSDRERTEYLELEVYDSTLVHVQPTIPLAECYRRAGLYPRGDVYRIAMWYWELSEVPDEWQLSAEHLDELWAPTRFIADALRRRIRDIPVFELTPGVHLEGIAPFDRGRLGISSAHTLFLFVFDMCSYLERKNPLGLIKAFRLAFRKHEKVRLVIKASNMGLYPEEASLLRDSADRANVILLEETLTRAELYGLMRECDCYVSLHRSEGLGLTMAEAMLLGRPVIGTGYSGNLDFMDRGNSILVGCDQVPLARQIGPYSKDLLWAEPSTVEAAEAMRWIHENHDEARALGERARISAEEKLSLQASGRRYARRLEEIQRKR